jgi:hypothetical protein
LSEIANPISLAAVDCDAGDDVFVIGYPLTLRQGHSNLPIVRKGILASSPRRQLVDVEEGSVIRGCLVDGAIMPGSSGSPVISTSTRFIGGDISVTPYRPLILGVVAQEWGRGKLQRYNAAHKLNQDVAVDGYANLGFAHSAGTIIETIAQLGHHGPKDFLRLDHENWAPQTGIPEWAVEFDGPFRDAVTIDRIMRRVNRDRMRRFGTPVILSEYHDAIEIMGPVMESKTNVNASDHYIVEYMKNPWAARPQSRVSPPRRQSS